MRFSTTLAILASVAGFASAADNRLLYNIPSSETPVSFAVAFGNACATYAPAIAAGLTFEAFQVQPGNFQGQNTQTQAKIFCSFWDAAHVITTFTDEVATSVGATAA
ncbi:Glycoside hydrolase family 81 protein [Mycena indigotica]|uniref:Glycoside hydrolase family 81 protein n=1 Tax=Mycena indigotica TaxID=2126181 RepID=A0A8H6TCC1_9AGAR|nr:Glycoside hydrolase family 81 protein [Mycena indigotica]KAF7315943.1 Glycoside hydrolase family 81 protein [Mycena indigotica]